MTTLESRLRPFLEAAAIAGLLLLAGCVGGGCSTPSSLTSFWSEPGLFREVQEVESHGAIVVDHRPAIVPHEGYRVVDETHDTLYGPGNYAVHGVVWVVPEGKNETSRRYDLGPMFDLGPRLDSTGIVRLAWRGDVSAARVDMERFIANVTGLPPASVVNYGEAFAKNATASSRFWPGNPDMPFEGHVYILDHVRLQQAWDRLSADGVAAMLSAPGHFPWSFSAGLASVAVQKTGEVTWTFSIDAGGNAGFTTDTGDETEFRQRLVDARKEMGLSPGETTPRIEAPSRTCE